jgi:hypothetical protein
MTARHRLRRAECCLMMISSFISRAGNDSR